MFVRRAYWLVSCLALASCFGGPTSDWPPDKAAPNDDEETSGPPREGLDAGSAARADAAAPSTNDPNYGEATDAEVDDAATEGDAAVLEPTFDAGVP